MNSKNFEHHVKVIDDVENSGGFLILEWWQGSNGPHSDSAFDSWVESHLAANEFIKEAGWHVKWQA
ncbi:MAG: hypothetical protein PHE96_08715 [Methylococcales bacterium]|nr:hypothetical protein [Methylococcales bacterium]